MKKKILVTLEGSEEKGEYCPLDVLEFVKRNKGLEASAAVSLVLMEWYETRSQSAAYSGRSRETGEAVIS